MRAGTFLASLAQLFLASSVKMVYTQLLWLGLAQDNPKSTTAHDLRANARDNGLKSPKLNTTSLRVLDIVTSAESSIMSLLHFWHFKKLKLAYAIVITAWYVLLEMSLSSEWRRTKLTLCQ